MEMIRWTEFKPEEKKEGLQWIILKDAAKIIGPCWTLPSGFLGHEVTDPGGLGAAGRPRGRLSMLVL